MVEDLQIEPKYRNTPKLSWLAGSNSSSSDGAPLLEIPEQYDPAAFLSR